MKTFVKFIVIAAILIGGGVYVALRVLNAFSTDAIERTLGYVFQAKADVGGARLSAKDTSLELRNCTLGSPEGYSAEHSFAFDRASVTLDPGTIKSGRPGISTLILHKPIITVEFKDRTTNLSQLIENASRFTTPDPDQPAAIPVYFKKIILEEPTAIFLAPVIGTPIRTPIPTFEVNNLGTADKPITAAEASAQFAREILVTVARNASGELPNSLALALNLESVKAIAQSAGRYKDVLQEKWGEAGQRFRAIQDAIRDGAAGFGEDALNRLRTPPEP